MSDLDQLEARIRTSAIKIHTPEDFEGMRRAGRLGAECLDMLTPYVVAGAVTDELDRLARGETGILVGTHAVFQKDVVFHDLRLAVVDEQHRFGVAQRMELGAKGSAVDVLVMTATPMIMVIVRITMATIMMLVAIALMCDVWCLIYDV